MDKYRAPRRLRTARAGLSEKPVCELSLVFASLLKVSEGSSCAPIYSPARTFWLFLYQVLSPAMACRAVTLKALAWLRAERGEKASTGDSAYVQARRRLDTAWLLDLARQVAGRLEEPADCLLRGKRILSVDGSSASMPDTLENRLRWPQPSGQKRGCGFPCVRIVALFSLATGGLVQLAHGPLEQAEQSLWRMLWGTLREGDVILADRGFSSFAELYLLSVRGVDSIVRKNARRTVGARRVKRLGKNDWLVEWTRDKSCPNWLSSGHRKRLPATLLVREITFAVGVPGFRTESVTVATTLLDPETYPRDLFPCLYRRRWEAELRLRDLKTVMGMDVLTTKSPEMVEKELAMYWLAYNLVRGLMTMAAARHGGDPVRISFKGSLDLIRQWGPEATKADAGELADLHEFILEYLAAQKLRSRPDRSEPRAVKRRPKTYARLTKPRHEFQDIPHRNRYKNPVVNSTVSAT